MAGKPGRSGGARPGAGRKPSPPVLNDSKELVTDDPLIFLTRLMNDASSDMKLRADAAKALMPFVHPKIGEGGKKDAKADAAKKAAAGRFAPKAPPKLVVSNG